MKRRVVHLITGLTKAGAETMLYQIIKYRTEESPDYYVITLGLSHYYEDMIRNMGVEVLELDIRKHPFITLRRIRTFLKKDDILCCWMYIPNLIGYIVGRKKVSKLIWCIRHSDLSQKNNSRKTLIINRICERVSPKVDVIAYNGERSRKVHSDAGYKPVRDIVLENGLDLSEYRYDDELRKQVRKELGIEGDKKVILSVARNHPIKDLPTFVKAFASVKSSRDDVTAVMCGPGITGDDDKLCDLCGEYGLEIGKDIHLIGFREDTNAVLNISDVYVLHSAGEAFPNILIQAMAAGIPVVSTDVGDVIKILGNSNYVVPVGDHKGIADKISEILDMSDSDRTEMISSNRNIVEEKYDIGNVVRSYEEMYLT